MIYDPYNEDFEAEMERENAALMAQYEPAGIMFDIFFQVHENGWPKEPLYYLHQDHLVVDFEMIFAVPNSPTLGTYVIGTLQKVIRLFELDVREGGNRNVQYDTVIYRKKTE
jgi:hypothetical protein